MIKNTYFKTAVILFIIIALPILGQQLTKIFKTPDLSHSLSTPADWQILALNDAADIQVGNLQKEQYFILLSEEKTDLYGWNLKKHSFVTLGNLLASLNDPAISGPSEMEINQRPAIQYEIEGSTSGLKIVYLHTTVETDSAFNQLLAWTLKSKYSENNALLKDVINSFSQTR